MKVTYISDIEVEVEENASAFLVFGLWGGTTIPATPCDLAKSTRYGRIFRTRSAPNISSSGMPPTGMPGCSSKPRQSTDTSNSPCSLTRLPCSATKQKGQTKSDQIRTGIAMRQTLIPDMIRRMTATPKTAAPSMELRKRVALVAHDNKKEDLLDWARFNQGTLSRHELLGTGTTGKLIHDRLGLDVQRLLSGPTPSRSAPSSGSPRSTSNGRLGQTSRKSGKNSPRERNRTRASNASHA